MKKSNNKYAVDVERVQKRLVLFNVVSIIVFTSLYLTAVIVPDAREQRNINHFLETASISFSFIGLLVFTYALLRIRKIITQLNFVKIRPVYMLFHIVFVALYILSIGLFEYFLYR